MIILKFPPVRAQAWTPERKTKLTFVISVVTDVPPDPKPEETYLLTRADIMYVIMLLNWARFLQPSSRIAEMCKITRFGYFRERKPPRERTS